MPKSLAEINEVLKSAGVDPADLTQIIADIKSAVRASDAGVIADKEKEIADLNAKLAEATADKDAGDADAKAKLDAVTIERNEAIRTREAILEQSKQLATAASEAWAALRAGVQDSFQVHGTKLGAVIAHAGLGFLERQAEQVEQAAGQIAKQAAAIAGQLAAAKAAATPAQPASP